MVRELRAQGPGFKFHFNCFDITEQFKENYKSSQKNKYSHTQKFA